MTPQLLFLIILGISLKCHLVSGDPVPDPVPGYYGRYDDRGYGRRGPSPYRRGPPRGPRYRPPGRYDYDYADYGGPDRVVYQRSRDGPRIKNSQSLVAVDPEVHVEGGCSLHTNVGVLNGPAAANQPCVNK